jgi:cell wall-associated NlpC family hydrolase
VKVRSLHDNYEGWMTSNMLYALDEKKSSAGNDFVIADIMSPIHFNAAKLLVPMGSALPAFADGKGTIGELSYEVAGNYANRFEQPPGPEKLTQLITAWLNVPYMWGGRTPLGADCSGFVQVVYKMMGIDLPRDTWQQAQEGQPVKKLKDAKPGDLVFFDDKDEIVHIGILLSTDQVVHCFGKYKDVPTLKAIVQFEF